MRRVVVTGMGIVSSIGNSSQEVLASLREAKSGIVRADKSGTSEGFSAYLSLASADFGAAVGAGQLPAWPGAVQRAEGNDGVIKLLAGQAGAISYTSHDRVLRDRLKRES